jgi:hypothetical protein
MGPATYQVETGDRTMPASLFSNRLDRGTKKSGAMDHQEGQDAMNDKVAGDPVWAAPALLAQLRLERAERWQIYWTARRDRVRYGRVPIGQPTGWTREQNERYGGIAKELRLAATRHHDRLQVEQARLLLDTQPSAVNRPEPQTLPGGMPSERHQWALRRRAELRAQASLREQQVRGAAAGRRLAEIAVELDRLPREYESVLDLCQSAYRIRIEIYNRGRLPRTERSVTEVPPAPPFDGPPWPDHQAQLFTIRSRSA